VYTFALLVKSDWRPDSVFGGVIRLPNGQKTHCDSWHEKQISVFFKSAGTAIGPTQPTNRQTPELFFAGEKLPGHEADHSLQPGAFIAEGVKKEKLP
jgi:hypothetical protein